MDKVLSKFQIGNIYGGLIIILSGVIPTGLLLRKIFGGMYGPSFKNISPAIYHLINISISYLVTGLFVYVFLKRLDIFNRLKKDYASTALFAVGNGIILFYLAVRIFSSTIPGGGAPMVVSMLGIYPLLISKALLYIAIVRVLIGVEPRTKQQIIT
ncbi:MAG: hypothetical protein AB7D06_07970 [Pedobacter sp.]